MPSASGVWSVCVVHSDLQVTCIPSEMRGKSKNTVPNMEEEAEEGMPSNLPHTKEQFQLASHRLGGLFLGIIDSLSPQELP